MNATKAKKDTVSNDTTRRQRLVDKVAKDRPWMKQPFIGNQRHIAVQVFEWEGGANSDPHFIDTDFCMDDNALASLCGEIADVLKKYGAKYPVPKPLREAVDV